jgi:hypothetical protein
MLQSVTAKVAWCEVTGCNYDEGNRVATWSKQPGLRPRGDATQHFAVLREHRFCQTTGNHSTTTAKLSISDRQW